MERLPNLLRDQYKSDFNLADEGFLNDRVAATTKGREKYWKYWQTYVQPLGVDPFLQNTEFRQNVRALSGFAARVRTGYFGRGRQISAQAVNSALTAIGTSIALDRGINPTKIHGSDKLLPRLAQMLEGWRQKDPPITKKLPIEVDIPEYISRCARGVAATPQDHAVGDLVLIAFYYLLRVGEYTIKGSNNSTKRTVQFKVNDVTFFWKDPTGTLRQLSRSAPDADIMSAHSATLKLDNQKNGWKGVCIHQEHNGEKVHCPVRALGRRYAHIRAHTTDSTAPIST